MPQLFVKELLNIPARILWEVIGKFTEPEKFAPWIVTSEVDGYGVGSKRTLVMQDGTKLFERLDELDEKARRLRYTITGACPKQPLPVENYTATMQVEEVGDTQCKIIWSAEFDMLGEGEAEVISQIQAMMKVGIDGLAKLHERTN